METIVVLLIVLFILLLPVRLGAWLLKAKRQTWWACFLVLFAGIFFVNVLAALLPMPWLADPLVRAGVVFFVFFVASLGILEMPAWKAALMAIMICAVYTVSMSNPGAFGVKLG